VLIIGMSVAVNVVEALLSQGIAATHLVDMDIIEPSNLTAFGRRTSRGVTQSEAISRKVGKSILIWRLSTIAKPK